jgi:hypothetical protein
MPTTMNTTAMSTRGKAVYWGIASMWLLIAVALLGLGLVSFGSSVATETPTMLAERRMLTFFGMQLIGFPLAMFLPGPLSDLARTLGLELFNVGQPTIAAFGRDWLILLVLGWVQWFIAIPWLIGVFRRRGSKNMET